MPLFLTLAAALSISAAAFFNGSQQYNSEQDVKTQERVEVQAEASHNTTQNSEVQTKGKVTSNSRVAIPDVDSSYDFSSIGTLHTVFNDDAAEEETSDDASIYTSQDVGISSGHAAVNGSLSANIN